MKLLENLALSTTRFFNRIGVRNTRVRKGVLEIVPSPLVTRKGIQSDEGLGGELGGEAVDGWQITVDKITMRSLFGPNYLSVIQPHQSDWEIAEDGAPWRKCRVMGEPEIQETGYVSFNLVALGFGVQ